MTERRGKKRYGITLPGSYLSRTWSADGHVFNISSSGLLFETIDLPPDQPSGVVRVDLRWPAVLNGRSLFVRCQGKVIWSCNRQIAVKLLGYEFRVRGNGYLTSGPQPVLQSGNGEVYGEE